MKRNLFIAAVMLIPALAFADVIDPAATNTSFDLITATTAHLSSSLQSIGIKLFFALTLLQLVITGYGQIASGEIEATMGKFAKALIWTSFVIWLMTNNMASNFVSNTIQYFLNNAIGWASGTSATFDVNGIMSTGMAAIGNVIKSVAAAATPKADLTTFITYFTPGAGLLQAAYGVAVIVFTVAIIAISSAYVALKVFMVKIEAALVVAILPLSLSFLGLNALRDQGFAPFKSMLALIYRIVILGAIVGGMASVGSAMSTYASSAANPTILEVGFSLSFGFVILAFLAHKSDSIAASLANGSANLGSGDAVGTAMAAVAAAGAAVAGVGAIAAAGSAAGSSTAKSMGDVMKGLTGNGGGTVSNASAKGVGRTPEPGPSKPNASMSDTAKSSSSAPKRNDYTSNSPASGNSSSDNDVAPRSGNSDGSQSSSATDSGEPASGTSSSSTSSSNETANTSGTSPSGSDSNAGIGGAPQRDVKDQLARDNSSSAPKRASHGENMQKHLNTLGQHTAQEKAATHVSINTNAHD